MDINKIIAANLSEWMGHPHNITIQQLSKKSGVGFGTIRRAKNGDGNITVANLEAVATALKRTAIDLITPPDKLYRAAEAVASDYTSGNIAELPKIDPLAIYKNEIVTLAEAMNEEGRWQLMGQAKLLATTHPASRKNHAS